MLLDARAQRLGFLVGGANARRFAEFQPGGQVTPIARFDVIPRNRRDLFTPIGFLGNAERDSLRRTPLQHLDCGGYSSPLTSHRTREDDGCATRSGRRFRATSKYPPQRRKQYDLLLGASRSEMLRSVHAKVYPPARDPSKTRWLATTLLWL